MNKNWFNVNQYNVLKTFVKGETMNTYIFKHHNTLYVLHEDSEECAWNRLQNKLSWNMKIVKQRVKLLDTMREVDNRVLKIKLN